MGFFLTYNEALQQELGPPGVLQLFQSGRLESEVLHQRLGRPGQRFLRQPRRGGSQCLYQLRQGPGGRSSSHSPRVGNVVLPYQFKISSVFNLQSGRTYDRIQSGPAAEPRLYRHHHRHRPATASGCRPSISLGSRYRQDTSISARERISASTSRFSTCSTTMPSSGGETSTTRLVKNRSRAAGSCRGGRNFA